MEAVRGGQLVRGRISAVGPQSQPPGMVLGLADELVDQHAAQALAPGRGAHRQLGGRPLGRIADVEVGVAEQARRVLLLGQQVQGAAAAVTQVQHDVLAQGVGAVDARGLIGQREGGADLLVGQVRRDPDASVGCTHRTGSRRVAAVATSRPSSWRGGTNR